MYEVNLEKVSKDYEKVTEIFNKYGLEDMEYEILDTAVVSFLLWDSQREYQRAYNRLYRASKKYGLTIDEIVNYFTY